MLLRESTEAIFTQGDGCQCCRYTGDFDPSSLSAVLDFIDLLSVSGEVQRGECADRGLAAEIDVCEPSMGLWAVSSLPAERLKGMRCNHKLKAGLIRSEQTVDVNVNQDGEFSMTTTGENWMTLDSGD